jgi:D-beta-D-heptose 7-phosphate kinase/D-beta-D-heptose 1-phosphate adenosyltransferase
MAKSRIERICGAFGSRRIMVIGDAMLDRYVWGDVLRISPEAPVPVVQVQRETCGFGGAANVARNLRTMGVKPFLLSLCGADDSAKKLIEMLAAIGCATDGIVTSKTRPTTVKTRVMAKHQQIVRIDNETGSELTARERQKLWRIFENRLKDMDAVIISDYSKGVVSPPFIGDVIGRCKRAGVFVAIDPKIRHFQYYQGVDVITPNLAETHAALSLPLRQCSDEDVREMGWKLLDMLELKNLLITLSERGMALFEKKGRVINHLPTMAQAVYDVTGAGDTVISAYTAAICCKALPIEAAFMANHAAGLTVAEVGTASVTARQLAKACCG